MTDTQQTTDQVKGIGKTRAKKIQGWGEGAGERTHEKRKRDFSKGEKSRR